MSETIILIDEAREFYEMLEKKRYVCRSCGAAYRRQDSSCPGCGRHPHLEDSCDHDCDWCDSVAFPPLKNGK